MNTQDMPRFTKLLKILGDHYRRPLTEEVSELYWVTLQKYDIAVVEQGVYQHLTSLERGHFFPMIGDIVRGITGNEELQALSAWTQVAEAICSVGAYDSVMFSDPLIHAVIIDMGGWVTLCHTPLQELPLRALEFQKCYRGLLTLPPSPGPAYLCGLCEHHNTVLGYSSPPPRLVHLHPQLEAKSQLLEGIKNFQP